jgi:ferredoxin
MRVESESAEIRALRRTGIELLLADHAGDCHAPCEHTCPARMDIPDMLRHVAAGDYDAAIEIVKREIALPAILGRVCPQICERACRRGQHDSPAAICRIKQLVADRDLNSQAPHRPACAPPTGKRVAIVGGGPTGLTAAYHLARHGHRCTLIEQHHQLGGRLRREFSPDVLPEEVLEREADAALAIGTEKRLGQRLGTDFSVDDLVHDFNAVLLAIGRSGATWVAHAGIGTGTSGIRVDADSRMTSRAGVFAAGNAVRPYALVVQSVAEGKLAAHSIDAWLRGLPMPDRHHAFETRLARLTSGELRDFCSGCSPTPRIAEHVRVDELSDDQLRGEARRCLECDCAAIDVCSLHHYAALYHCDARRFHGSGRRFEGRLEAHGVVLEPGKCILCGKCVQLTHEAADAKGLAILGRSLETRIGPPPGATLTQALGSAACACAAACPTGAISLKHRESSYASSLSLQRGR